MLAYALLLTVACGVLFGLAPVFQALRSDVVSTLRGEPAPKAARPGWSVRDGLVVVQVAVSIVLLIGAGLFLRSLQEASRIDPGFDAENVLLMRYDLGRSVTDERRRLFEAALAGRVASLRGVEAVTFAERVPIAQPYGRRSVRIEGYEPAPGEEMEFPFNVVGGAYFEVMRVPLVEGRGFTEADRPGAAPVVVVNESFARRFWPDGSALGRSVVVGRETREVVGVARDGKYWSLGEAPRPYYYLPRLQESAAPALHVRVNADPLAFAGAVRDAAREIEPAVAVLDVGTMEAAIASSLMPQRTAGKLLSFFGVLALALAAAGLYGVMAYVVGRRMAEFGIRIALGARSRDVMRLVLGRAFALTGAGALLGVGLAVVAARLAASMLFAVSPWDVRTFAATIALLVAVALVASWLPAWRAVRSDPMRSLRTE